MQYNALVRILATMRIRSSFLKLAVCLSLGASAVFGGAANALSFNWSWTATQGDDGSGGDLTGTVVTGTIDNLTDNFLNTVGMTATFTSGFNVGRTLDFFMGKGIRVTNGSIVVSGLEAVFFDSNFTYGLQLADPVTGTTPGSASDFSLNAYLNTFAAPTFSTAEAVPAPIPILGLPAAFLSTRKLRKRIKARREALGASLG